MATLVHDDIVDGARVRRGRAAAWTGSRSGGRARSRRPPVRARLRRARGSRRRRRARDRARRRVARARARRGAPAPPAQRPVDHGRGLRRPRARSRPASSSRRHACWGAAARSTGCSSGSRSRSPTTSSTAPATRSRRGRSRAPICATGRRRCPLILAAREDEVVRAALAGGPLDGVLVRVAATRRPRALPGDRPRLR